MLLALALKDVAGKDVLVIPCGSLSACTVKEFLASFADNIARIRAKWVSAQCSLIRENKLEQLSSGTMVMQQRYRLHYVLQYKLFIVAITGVDDNPFEVSPLFFRTRNVLRSVCKGEEATAAAIDKKYGEVWLAFLQIIEGGTGTISQKLTAERMTISDSSIAETQHKASDVGVAASNKEDWAAGGQSFYLQDSGNLKALSCNFEIPPSLLQPNTEEDLAALDEMDFNPEEFAPAPKRRVRQPQLADLPSPLKITPVAPKTLESKQKQVPPASSTVRSLVPPVAATTAAPALDLFGMPAVAPAVAPAAPAAAPATSSGNGLLDLFGGEPMNALAPTLVPAPSAPSHERGVSDSWDPFAAMTGGGGGALASHTTALASPPIPVLVPRLAATPGAAAPSSTSGSILVEATRAGAATGEATELELSVTEEMQSLYEGAKLLNLVINGMVGVAIAGSGPGGSAGVVSVDPFVLEVHQLGTVEQHRPNAQFLQQAVAPAADKVEFNCRLPAGGAGEQLLRYRLKNRVRPYPLRVATNCVQRQGFTQVAMQPHPFLRIPPTPPPHHPPYPSSSLSPLPLLLLIPPTHPPPYPHPPPQFSLPPLSGCGPADMQPKFPERYHFNCGIGYRAIMRRVQGWQLRPIDAERRVAGRDEAAAVEAGQARARREAAAEG
jgi:hypothetical protein